MANKRKGSVVKTAAHAHPITVLIKAHQWQQYQIQRPGGEPPSMMRAVASIRLADTEAVTDHGRV